MPYFKLNISSEIKNQKYNKISYIELLILLFSCFNRYVVSAPKVLRVGASENIVIQVYGYTEAFDAVISIKSYPGKEFSYASESVILSTENKFQNSAILTVCICPLFSLYM